MNPPELWRKASNERYTRLGALVTRRALLSDDLAGVDRQIAELQMEILSLHRTADLAAEVAAPPASNGHAEAPG